MNEEIKGKPPICRFVKEHFSKISDSLRSVSVHHEYLTSFSALKETVYSACLFAVSTWSTWTANLYSDVVKVTRCSNYLIRKQDTYLMRRYIVHLTSWAVEIDEGYCSVNSFSIPNFKMSPQKDKVEKWPYCWILKIVANIFCYSVLENDVP